MPRYTLDYSTPSASRPRPRGWPRRRMQVAFRRATTVLCALLCGIALVGLLRLQAENDAVREQYDGLALRYDSLLSAKLEADRRLARLQDQLADTSRQSLAKPLRQQP